MSTRQKQLSSILSREMQIKRPEEIREELFKCINVKNNRYHLNVSEKECLKMGISPLEYRKLVVDLAKTNKLIAESEKQGRQIIELGSSQKLSFSNGTSGYISVNNMDAVKRKIFIPAGYNKVRFHSCVPKSSIYTIITCGVSVLGGGFTFDSLHSTKFWVRSTEIALKSNNCNGELFFEVGDSTGGFGSWELLK